MSDHQGKRLRPGTAFVNKMNFYVVDVGMKLTEPVNRVFLRSPVEFCLPLVNNFLHVPQAGAVSPLGIGTRIRPTGLGKSSFQLGQGGI